MIGATAYILGSILYFVIFWCTTGQTPGARMLQIRVVSSDGARVKQRWAVVRTIGVLLAALPLFAGFVPILFDRRRRGFQDWLARTAVVEAPGAVDRRGQPGEEAGDPRGLPPTTAGDAPVTRVLIRFG